MRYVRNAGLNTYPMFGAVPPFPDVTTDPQNYDRVFTGGGTIAGSLGCKHAPPAMTCIPPVDRPMSLWADAGDWTLNSAAKGHGTLVIDGNLQILEPFEWWGTVIVKGQLAVRSGPLRIHGGLVVREIEIPDGQLEIRIDGGGSTAGIPVGRSVVTGRAWRER